MKSAALRRTSSGFDSPTSNPDRSQEAKLKRKTLGGECRAAFFEVCDFVYLRLRRCVVQRRQFRRRDLSRTGPDSHCASCQRIDLILFQDVLRGVDQSAFLDIAQSAYEQPSFLAELFENMAS